MESDNHDMVASKLGSDDKTRNTAAKPKTRIGKIGGNTELGIESSKQAVASPTKVTGHMKTKMNTELGSDRMRQQESISKASEPARVGRSTMQALSPSSTRETSQERANRKREQLKRELESKGQAGAKKKRKF